MQVKVTRLDYKNPPAHGRGLYTLPTLNSLDEITDINEINSVEVVFSNKLEAEAFAAMFPKSYKFKVQSTTYADGREKTYDVCAYFNTFWMDGTTGTTNEAATTRRVKVVKKLKEILGSLK